MFTITFFTTYQFIKNVSLMHVDGDEGFKLDTFYFSQFLCSDFNQLVQHVQEKLISLIHDLQHEMAHVYLTIIPWARVGYEMVNSQRGAKRRVGYNHSHIQQARME